MLVRDRQPLFLLQMEQTSSYPPVDALYNTLRKIDYVDLGNKTIYFLATVIAIVIGVSSYISTATQLWWCDNGENIINKVNLNSNRVIDYLFYTSVDGI